MVLRLIHEEMLRAGPLYLSPWQPTCCLDTTRCYLFPLDQTEPGSKGLCLLGKARGGLVRCMMSAFGKSVSVCAFDGFAFLLSQKDLHSFRQT